jgi:predicted GIY-YIG superfamily endonuclease
VDNFKELSKMFLTEFLAFWTRKKPSEYLLRLYQHNNQTLNKFVARFNREKMVVDDPTEDMVYAALYQGISPEEPLMRKLAQKQPSSLQGLMDKEEEYIHQEEALKAMDSSRPSRDRSLGRKKKDFRKAKGEDQRQVKKFKDYNFTPLNAEILEILMEIKRDPEFCQPSKIPGNPPQKNEGKYGDFLKQRGHYTEGCITLRLLI